MAKPLEEHSDEELQRDVAEGEFGDKKKVMAQEILRRRQEPKTQELKRKYKWFGGIRAAHTQSCSSANQRYSVRLVREKSDN
jgi:hypothetical protein